MKPSSIDYQMLSSRSAKIELHRNFHDDIYRRSAPRGRREPPLPHCLNRALVETRVEPPQDLHVADGSVAADDKFQDDLAFETPTSRVVGVIRLDFPQQPRRLDAGTRPIRAPTRSSAGSSPHARTIALPNPCSLARSYTASLAWTAALHLGLRLLKDADAIAVVSGRGDDWRHDRGQRL